MRVKFVVGFVLLMAIEAFCQQTPFSATETHTLQVISPDGRITEHKVTQRRYFHSSSGATLTQDLSPDKVPIRAQLTDYGRTKKAYLIDYVNERAQVERELGDRMVLPRSRSDVKNALGSEIVHRFECLILPSYLTDERGRKELIGTGCIAPELNFLRIKEDITMKLKDGRSERIVTELEDIRVGDEPDPSLFAIDSASIRRAKSLMK